MRDSLKTLGQIWHDRLPNGSEREYSLIEKLVCTVVILISLLSLGNWGKLLARRVWPGTRVFMDIYVLVWFVLLCVLLRSDWNPGCFLIVIVGYRIIEVVNYRLLFLFVKSETDGWTAEVIRRSLAIALINFVEVTVAFAILYLRTGSIKQVSTPLDALYFSAVTMTTVGYGDFVPACAIGRRLVVAQLGAAVLFIIFLLPALISVFSPGLMSDKTNHVS